MQDCEAGQLCLPDHGNRQQPRGGVQHEDGVGGNPELEVNPKLDSPATPGIRRSNDPRVPPPLVDLGLRRPCLLNADEIDASFGELLF